MDRRLNLEKAGKGDPGLEMPHLKILHFNRLTKRCSRPLTPLRFLSGG